MCSRRDRNRATALATYYRRKARLAELTSQVAALTAQNAALSTLADAAEGSEECGRAHARHFAVPSLLPAPVPHVCFICGSVCLYVCMHAIVLPQ